MRIAHLAFLSSSQGAVHGIPFCNTNANRGHIQNHLPHRNIFQYVTVVPAQQGWFKGGFQGGFKGASRGASGWVSRGASRGSYYDYDCYDYDYDYDYHYDYYYYYY